MAEGTDPVLTTMDQSIKVRHRITLREWELVLSRLAKLEQIVANLTDGTDDIISSLLRGENSNKIESATDENEAQGQDMDETGDDASSVAECKSDDFDFFWNSSRVSKIAIRPVQESSQALNKSDSNSNTSSDPVASTSSCTDPHNSRNWETISASSETVGEAVRPGYSWHPISEKIMLNMGFKPGSGLGKDLQGIPEPIQLQSNKKTTGLGYDQPNPPTEKKSKRALKKAQRTGCPECERKFNNLDSLVMHMGAKHGQKKSSLPTAGTSQSFAPRPLPAVFQGPPVAHGAQPPKTQIPNPQPAGVTNSKFQCPKCLKYLGKKARANHASNCPATFAQSGQLGRNQPFYTTTNENNPKICTPDYRPNKYYTDSFGHGIISKPVAGPSTSTGKAKILKPLVGPNPPITDGTPFKFQCPVCQVYFRRRRQVTNHLSSLGPGLTCPGIAQ